MFSAARAILVRLTTVNGLKYRIVGGFRVFSSNFTLECDGTDQVHGKATMSRRERKMNVERGGRFNEEKLVTMIYEIGRAAFFKPCSSILEMKVLCSRSFLTSTMASNFMPLLMKILLLGVGWTSKFKAEKSNKTDSARAGRETGLVAPPPPVAPRPVSPSRMRRSVVKNTWVTLDCR
jgi:hypothetical protein